MPITYIIDHEHRLVRATGAGTLTDEDVFGYQREVWSRPDVAGYDELIEMNAVERITVLGSARIRELANLSAAMDTSATSSKFAIVARDDLAYGLGRMYQTFRELVPGSAKEVRVFRSLPAALAFLDVEGGAEASKP